MTMVEEEVRPMLLGGDRELLRDLVDLDPAHRELVAPRRPGVLAHDAGEGERALLREGLRLLPGRFRDIGLRDHRLHEARAVAKDQKLELSARPAIVEPTLHGDGLTLMAGQLIDVDLVFGAHIDYLSSGKCFASADLSLSHLGFASKLARTSARVCGT